MRYPENYLESIQELFELYRRGEISKLQLEARRELLNEELAGDNSTQHEVATGGRGFSDLFASRSAVLLAAALCSLFLVLTIGFAGLGPDFPLR